jgi:hypothetical protein
VKDDRTDGADALLKKLAARYREERDEPLPPGVRPFDEAAVERITAKLLGTEPSASSPAKVLRPWRFAWVGAPLAAAAAAIALWVGTRPAADALPAYELDVVRAKTSRAPGEAREAEVTLDPDGDLELVARPATPAPDIGARAVLVRDGAARPWAAPIDVSSEGAVRIAGANKALFPETRGTWEIVVLVAKKDALPSEAEAARVAVGPPPAPPLRSVRAKVRFLEP